LLCRHWEFLEGAFLVPQFFVELIMTVSTKVDSAIVRFINLDVMVEIIPYDRGRREHLKLINSSSIHRHSAVTEATNVLLVGSIELGCCCTGWIKVHLIILIQVVSTFILLIINRSNRGWHHVWVIPNVYLRLCGLKLACVSHGLTLSYPRVLIHLHFFRLIIITLIIFINVISCGILVFVLSLTKPC